MGYSLVDAALSVRGRWDWLYELVDRQLHGRSQGETEPPPPSEDGTAAPDALRDALGRLGLSTDAVIEGVASVLGLTPHQLMEPGLSVVRRSDPEQLSVLLPFLLHHDNLQIRAIGERWLRCRSVAYQLPPAQLLSWLESDRRIGDLLEPRLRAEGLAMLGPDALMRLSRTGLPRVREAARIWSHRLGRV